MEFLGYVVDAEISRGPLRFVSALRNLQIFRNPNMFWQRHRATALSEKPDPVSSWLVDLDFRFDGLQHEGPTQGRVLHRAVV